MPNDDHIFIKCQIKTKYDRGYSAKIKRENQEILNIEPEIRNKMEYDRTIIFPNDCGVAKGEVKIGGKEQGFNWQRLSKYLKYTICDFKYLGLSKDIGKTAEAIHDKIESIINKKNSIFENCDIYWGWKDIEFDWEVKEMSEQLENASFHPVECPTDYSTCIKIKEGIYECPKCKKIVKK